jgi:hypothetical protein
VGASRVRGADAAFSGCDGADTFSQQRGGCMPERAGEEALQKSPAPGWEFQTGSRQNCGLRAEGGSLPPNGCPKGGLLGL